VRYSQSYTQSQSLCDFVPLKTPLLQVAHPGTKPLAQVLATMDDKKNEDYGIKMPESVEMRNFNGRSSPAQRDPFLSKASSSRASTPSAPLSNITNSPPLSILAYCLASISMTITNKYCVSGANWNLNFFYLAIQVSAILPM